jgi:hypothetical protein
MGRQYVEGPFGWARYVPAPAGHRAEVSTVACWFIHAPGQGITYDDFMLGVVDLVEREGYPAPTLRYPRAEYELLVAGLDPSLNPIPGDVGTWRQLYPVNVAEQFHGISREQAAQLAEIVAWACVTGRLPVETQAYVEVDGQQPTMKYIKQALDVWKMSVLRAVDHLRTGGLHERVN